MSEQRYATEALAREAAAEADRLAKELAAQRAAVAARRETQLRESYLAAGGTESGWLSERSGILAADRQAETLRRAEEGRSRQAALYRTL